MRNPVPGIYLEKRASWWGTAGTAALKWGAKKSPWLAKRMGRFGGAAGEAASAAAAGGGAASAAGSAVATGGAAAAGGGVLSRAADWGNKYGMPLMLGSSVLGGIYDRIAGPSDPGYQMPPGVNMGMAGAPLASYGQYKAGVPDQFMSAMSMRSGPNQTFSMPSSSQATNPAINYAMPQQG